MTVKHFACNAGLDVITLPDPEKEINGVYSGDLLSWVMGNANPGNLWITIMSNINIVAVATLVDVSAIILCEGVKLDDSIIKTAENKSVNILSTKLAAYESALKIAETLN